MDNKNSSANLLTGNNGETIACEFLKKLKYEIIERNFRITGGEIDIVAKDPNGDLVFVEVKTRNSHEYGDPAEAVTPKKIGFLVRSAQFYLNKYDLFKHPYRLDAITVDFLNGQKIEHFKNITNY